MTKLHVNTKFVNHLQLEWSRFVTGYKQARNFHKASFDHLYAYLKQDEDDASKVRAMRARFPDPLTLMANTYNHPPSYASYPSQYHPQVQVAPQQQCYLPQQTYDLLVIHQQPPARSTSPNSGFTIPTFLSTDDLIASLNKAMIVMVQNVQGRQSQGYAGNTRKDHVDAYDLDRDEALTTSAIFMARLSTAGSVNGDDAYELIIYMSIPYADYNENEVVQDMNFLAQNDATLADKHDLKYVFDPEETFILAEESRLKLKDEKAEHNDKPVDYSKLNKLYEYFVPQKQIFVERAYSLPVSQMSVDKVKLVKDVPKQLPKMKVLEMKEIFERMETNVNQSSVEKKYFEIEKKKLLIENDRLLKECLSKELMCTTIRSFDNLDEYSEMTCKYLEQRDESGRLQVSDNNENVEKVI
nr:hypothetical protein [Tanacetum cinerariifolium]